MDVLNIIVTYGFGMGIQIVYGCAAMDTPRHHSLKVGRKHGARLILASPIWPAVLILAAVRGLFALIRTADIKIGRNQ